MSEVTQDRVKELLEYNPDTGMFRWRSHLFGSPNRRHGKLAGTINGHGRLLIKIDGTPYYAHRIAYLYVYGCFPDLHIDHINGDPLDNRICNLREADDQLNQQNRKRSSNTESGRVGVSRRGDKWRAYIRAEDRFISLGLFEDFDEAVEAREDAEKRYGFIASAPTDGRE